MNMDEFGICSSLIEYDFFGEIVYGEGEFYRMKGAKWIQNFSVVGALSALVSFLKPVPYS